MAKYNMADQFNLLKKVQKEMAELQDALEDMSVEGTAGGGMVTVKATGKQKILYDVEMLEDLIIAATNQALDKSREMAQEEMQKIAGGMLGNLPGGLKIPGLGL